MGELQMYGQADLGTQMSEPRETEGGGGTIAVEIKPEDGEERAGPGGRELRALSLTADEARAYAMKLLVAAGPESDRVVQNFRYGQVLVTVEAPTGCEFVANPWLFVGTQDEAEFNRGLDIFGGLLAFNEPRPADYSLH